VNVHPQPLKIVCEGGVHDQLVRRSFAHCGLPPPARVPIDRLSNR
jgi:hypothetical protein